MIPDDDRNEIYRNVKKTPLMKKATVIILLCLFAINIQTNAQLVAEKISNKNISDDQDDTTMAKKHLSPKEFNLWERIYSQYVSDNGDWCTYFKNVNNNVTLYLVSIKNMLKYSLPVGEHRFSIGSQWFASVSEKKELALINLETMNMERLSNVTKFEFTSDGRYLIYKTINQTQKPSQSNLMIRNLKTGKTDSIMGIMDYKISPDVQQLAIIQITKQRQSVKLITLGQSSSKMIISNDVYRYKHLIWNAKGTGLAFIEEKFGNSDAQKGYKIYCYNTFKGKQRLFSLDSEMFPGRQILYERFKLRFSKKGSVLYFKVRGAEDLAPPFAKTEVDVEVWKSDDKELYPTLKSNQSSKIYGARLAAWSPETGITKILETKSRPKAIVGNNNRYMLSYDPMLYEPSYATNVNSDIYLTDLKTGNVQLLLKQYGGTAYMSPKSNYIHYFKDRHWWVFDIMKKTHTNITKYLPVTWYKDFPKHPHKNGLKPYGVAGWTQGDKELIIYDKYDAWAVSPKGNARKLTQGREAKITHHIYSESQLYKDQDKQVHTGAFDVVSRDKLVKVSSEINLSNGLIFKIKGVDKSSGYAVWKQGKDTKRLVYKSMNLKGLLKAYKKEVYTYIEESFNIPPRIVCLNKLGDKPLVLEESNTQQKEYHWGRSELVYYKGPNGEDLQGALYYPANYTSKKKYPMVVEIYEKMSGGVYKYQAPSEYSSCRLNKTNYTLDGYFIFHPDISPVPNDIGMSAVNCVEAGVRAVIAKGAVDKGRIGLNGHSFGGYETNFIITKSDLFAAAVSGAGVADVVSSYHGFSAPASNLGSNISRSEDWQYNFRGSFYENQEAYIRNSPIYHLKDVNTPLMLWVGKLDDAVDYRQSFEMYFGLRRLNKICELAIYPSKGHNMYRSEPKYQIDLTRRIKAWFDKYLKPGQVLQPAPSGAN